MLSFVKGCEVLQKKMIHFDSTLSPSALLSKCTISCEKTENDGHRDNLIDGIHKMIDTKVLPISSTTYLEDFAQVEKRSDTQDAINEPFHPIAAGEYTAYSPDVNDQRRDRKRPRDPVARVLEIFDDSISLPSITFLVGEKRQRRC